MYERKIHTYISYSFFYIYIYSFIKIHILSCIYIYIYILFFLSYIYIFFLLERKENTEMIGNKLTKMITYRGTIRKQYKGWVWKWDLYIHLFICFLLLNFVLPIFKGSIKPKYKFKNEKQMDLTTYQIGNNHT